MNSLDFISKLIDSLSWPLTILILCLVFRKPILDALSSITRLKYKNLELDFLNLAESASRLPEQKSVVAELDSSRQAIYTSLEDQIYFILDKAPSASILLSWAGIETALSSAVVSRSISPDPPSQRSVMHNLEQLRKHANLPVEYFETINEMRVLRNKLAHDEKTRLSISYNDAKSYADTAKKIINYINSLDSTKK